MKRFKHSLSNYKLVTGDMGKIIPVGIMETLPGDTFQQSTSLLLRMSPMLAPVMHPVSVRIHHWFVPHRLVYPGWEDFITGGKDGLGSSVPYPTNAAPVTPVSGDLLDYMGVPIRPLLAGQLSLMPVRGYNKIYNEFYRDEDLCPEALAEQTDVLNLAWEKDYFTTARPWAQKGPAVTLPLGQTAPVIPSASPQIYWRTDGDGTARRVFGDSTTGAVSIPGLTGGNTGASYTLPVGLEADLANAVSPDIIDVRRAFALQRYQEARAQYGSRYTEYLRYLGVRSSDARLQRPEYLGGGKQTIAFSEVLRTGNESTQTGGAGAIGELKGHGIAAMRSNRYRYFCEEHGYIYTLLSIRPRTMYTDGLHKHWSRRTKEDYYQKELELIGQQEIKNSEVYLAGDAGDTATFGFQDRYAEYRHLPSYVAAEFRTLLDYWHLGRKFASLPVLNQSFIECDPSKRIFAEQTQHSCWIMVNNNVQVRRMVGNRTIGKIV